MTPQTLALLRDLSLMLLCLEAAVFVAVPGVILFFAQRYLRRFRHWLRLPLLRVQVYALRIQQLTLQVSERVITVPITLQMLNARLRTTARRVLPRS
jgi:hypothetical protein